MSTELMDPNADFSMNPEMITIVNKYLETTDVGITAEVLGIPREKVVHYINKPEAKTYINTIFLEQGYLNRNLIQKTMSKLIEDKLVELEEAGISSSKDIADLLAMAHKMRMDELKASGMLDKENVQPAKTTNIQVNSYGENYNSLLEKIISSS